MLTILAVNAIMLVLLEAPLMSFAVAPDWTPLAIGRFKAWMARNGAMAIAIGLAAIGIALIVRAVITIVA